MKIEYINNVCAIKYKDSVILISILASGPDKAHQFTLNINNQIHNGFITDELLNSPDFNPECIYRYRADNPLNIALKDD